MLVRRIAQHPEDLGARPDVDALGGLVQEEHLGSVCSHLASIAFCWLPPLSDLVGVLGSRRPDVELVQQLSALASISRARARMAPVKSDSTWSIMFSPTGSVGHAAVALAVAGQQREAVRHRAVGRHQLQIERTPCALSVPVPCG